MATNYSPAITTDSITLCLDANATRSYSGTGSTWYDLTPNEQNGTITGATYNSNGYFDFDGNDVVGPNTFDYDDSAGAFTVCAWLNPDTFTPPFAGNSYLAVINRSDNSTHTFSVFINSTSSSNTTGDMASWIADTGSTVRQHHASGDCILNLNEWNFCVWRWKDGFGYTYDLFNSEGQVTATGSSTYTIKKDSTSEFTIGRWRGSNYFYDGQMGCINFYNRKLSNAEILQNYNAQKSRFT